MIEKRCALIDYGNETPATVVSDPGESPIHVALHNLGDVPMNTILKLLDRAALAIFNAMLIAGLPLAAVGLMTNAI